MKRNFQARLLLHLIPIRLDSRRSSARSQLKATDNPSSDLKNVLVDTLKNVASSVSGILPMAGGALGAYFGNPTLGTAAGTAGQGLLNAILGGASEQF